MSDDYEEEEEAVEVEVEEIVVECNRKEHKNCDFSKYFFSVFSVLEK